MSRPRPIRRLLFAFALAVALAGCDDAAFVEPDPEPPAPGCAGACPLDLECARGACVGERGPDWPVALRILPQADDPLAAAEVRAFEAADPVTALPALPLSTRTPLVGRAVVPGPDGPVAIRVRATARALYGIETQALTIAGETVDERDGPRFVLQVAPFWPTEAGTRRGAVYALTLRPEEAERYPPWVVDDVRVDPAGGVVTVELPAADRLPAVEGEVLVSADNPTPIAGLRVFAVDDEGRRVSTETYTDASGRFTLRFWPAEAPRALTLRVRRAGDVGPVPDIDRPIEAPADADAERPFARVYLGELPSAVTITGHVDDGRAPLGGVVLRLRGEIGEGVFTVDAGPTDAEGAFTVTLYPGRYRVDLEPPADASARLARLEAALDAGSAPRWTLAPGTTIRGAVIDPAGDPLPRARIEVRLLSARYADPALAVPGETPPARIRQTETDDAGRFAMQLDPGEHAVRVVPPAESGLPSSEHDLSVPTLGIDLPPVELAVPPAAALAFELRGPDNAPAADVVVEAWRTDRQPPVRIGEATSAPDGSGVLRLPVGP